MIYSVSSQLYEEVQERISEAIGERSYFSGALSFDFEEVACRLVVSCFVYRKRVTMPEGAAAAICDLVPVWWEFHTCGEEGEMLNDFSFEELRARL
ncbi:MAG: hypothetical protein Q4A18_01220 [Rikenellaceae bacterium]|nr:hypothetical protein [Rikenellaceae bacterium]